MRKRVDVSSMPDDYGEKLSELDSILNDPEVVMQPSRVWALAAEIAGLRPSLGQ